MPKSKYDPERFDALDDEKKLGIIRDVLEDDDPDDTSKADMYMFTRYLFCTVTGELAEPNGKLVHSLKF